MLHTFHQFLVTLGKMLCFSGPNLERDSADLNRLTDKKLLVKDKFNGGYSLTTVGFAAMQECVNRDNAEVSTHKD